ncbi:hypothetical protein DOTSEDRAFT_71747 [Dothistroma septosporum NZE10]|uniref:Uncharacterized protein n=1 Tax=Dothistroma septosporum (strain NZE10 / CBS 128990) TaxID=675120 RepID=N1PM04_DOTSN|nr:hypothetical protein DOTSEDRAFT_71747 [Dothistroma septosporum NZE10]
MSTTPLHATHERHDSAVVDSYDGLPKLLPKTPNSTSSSPQCAFLSLPPDIRNMIYDLVFHCPDGILIDFTHSYHLGLGTLPSLASTCRQIYDESHDLPYWLNTFHFRLPVFRDLQALRAISPSMLKFPLPARDPSPRRLIRPADEKGSELRFVTMAMRDPHLEEIMQNFEEVVGQWRVTNRLRKVHVDLGSITNNTFLERVFHAWEEVAPRLAALSGSMRIGSETRLIFRLRLSKRFIVDYDFTLRERMATMREMDACVSRGAFDVEEFTLPELGTINAMRKRVWDTFFVSGLPGEDSLPPRLSRSFSSVEGESREQTLQRPLDEHSMLVMGI